MDVPEAYDKEIGGVTAIWVGTSGYGPASESLFKPYEANFRVLKLYCENENCGAEIENPRWNQNSCGADKCRMAVRRKKKNTGAQIPFSYFDIYADGRFLPHVLLSIVERECRYCGRRYEPGRYKNFCSSACYSYRDLLTT
jgi:hypothetical protein